MLYVRFSLGKEGLMSLPRISLTLYLMRTGGHRGHEDTHLDHVEVDLPVVARAAGDEPVSVSLLLRRVHRGGRLPGHARLQEKRENVT